MPIKPLYYSLVMTLLAVTLLTTSAYAEEITIISSAESKAYESISQEIEARIQSLDDAKKINSYSVNDLAQNTTTSTATTTVMLGKEALITAANKSVVSFIQPNETPTAQSVTVVSIYPEIAQLIAFAKHIAQTHHEQTIVIPVSEQFYEQLGLSVYASNFVKFIPIAEGQVAANVIKPWLFKPSIVLALPDSKIWSGSQAKWLLLNAYDQKVPVIGYSQAFLKAGAMASLYVDKELVIQCIAELAVKETCLAERKSNIYYPDLNYGFNPSIADILKFNTQAFQWD